MTRCRRHLLSLAVLGAFAGAGAHADELFGTAFDVIYDPSTLGLFGSLSLVGNTLEFTPNNFIAVSQNGQGVVTPTGATTASGIQLIANPGYNFSLLQLTELGDYQLSGAGSSVSLSGELIAFDGDASADPVGTYTTSQINATGPLNVMTGLSNTQNWTATAAINNSTTTVGGSGPWLSGATTVDLSIENLLSASTTEADSEALIQKKGEFGGVGMTASTVPVPGAAWLLGGALLMLVGFRKQALGKR
jgi:hypothetical protein